MVDLRDCLLRMVSSRASYCGNFEFFRQHKEGVEGRDTASLSELIFSKRIRLIMNLQDAAYSDDKAQAWRTELVDTCHGQITGLNDELVAVRLKKQFVEKYRQKNLFTCIGDTEKGELTDNIAPIVVDYDMSNSSVCLLLNWVAKRIMNANLARHPLVC